MSTLIISTLQSVKVSAMGIPVIKSFKGANVRTMAKPVKKETAQETRLRLAAADMKPLSSYWSKGNKHNK